MGLILINLGENVVGPMDCIKNLTENSAAKVTLTTTVLSRFGGLLLGN